MFKVFTLTAEFTKTELATKLGRSITSDDLVRVLDRLTSVHGHPRFVAMDSGPKTTCHAIPGWCRFSTTGSVLIEPGPPWHNAFVEAFKGTLRDKLLAIEVSHTLLEARVMADDCRTHSNTYRPHSSVGYRTPNE